MIGFEGLLGAGFIPYLFFSGVGDCYYYSF